MNIAMYWHDNDPKTDLAAKVAKAASYYATKYGAVPNLCFVHPSMLPPAAPQAVDGIELRVSAWVQNNHFWIGVDSK